MAKTKFQTWLEANGPSENKLYYRPFWDTYTFWRDRIFELFIDPKALNSYNSTIKEIENNVKIIGQHHSKSIVHPVVKISYKGCEIIFRYNFYDYEIAVISPIDLNIPESLIFGPPYFYQGFPEKYKILKSYKDSKSEFMVGVKDHYDFYTFMYLIKEQLNSEISNNSNKKSNDNIIKVKIYAPETVEFSKKEGITLGDIMQYIRINIEE